MDPEEMRQALTAQAETYRKAEAVAGDERGKLFDLVRQAPETGLRQVDIVKATGWTREYVHGIVTGKRGKGGGA